MLNEVSASSTTEELTGLVGRVDIDNDDYADVARLSDGKGTALATVTEDQR